MAEKIFTGTNLESIEALAAAIAENPESAAAEVLEILANRSALKRSIRSYQKSLKKPL